MTSDDERNETRRPPDDWPTPEDRRAGRSRPAAAASPANRPRADDRRRAARRAGLRGRRPDPAHADGQGLLRAAARGAGRPARLAVGSATTGPRPRSTTWRRPATDLLSSSQRRAGRASRRARSGSTVLRILAGTVPRIGPGVTITIDDPDGTVTAATCSTASRSCATPAPRRSRSTTACASWRPPGSPTRTGQVVVDGSSSSSRRTSSTPSGRLAHPERGSDLPRRPARHGRARRWHGRRRGGRQSSRSVRCTRSNQPEYAQPTDDDPTDGSRRRAWLTPRI